MSLAEQIDDPLLREERDSEGVLRLTMNRPAQRNALSMDLMAALIEALDQAGEDKDVRVVVIAGAGVGFCPGHDLREMRQDPSREAYARIFDHGAVSILFEVPVEPGERRVFRDSLAGLTVADLTALVA